MVAHVNELTRTEKRSEKGRLGLTLRCARIFESAYLGSVNQPSKTARQVGNSERLRRGRGRTFAESVTKTRTDSWTTAISPPRSAQIATENAAAGQYLEQGTSL